MLTDHHPIITLDLNFMGVPGTIASFLIPHKHGAVLVESGPGSTIPGLKAALAAHQLAPGDISDVLLTHIHLDHAGAAGWLARQGARIHVHPAGAPHLLDPQKLLSSAGRIYGDTMGTLFGEFLPVPAGKLSVLQNGQELQIGELCFRPLETPGHASHHFAYIFEGVCFSGDIGGVRLAGTRHIRLPMPPPEFHLEEWRSSLARLQAEFEQGSFTRIAPTHFGIYTDAGDHLTALKQALDDAERWMEAHLPGDPPLETVDAQFLAWIRQTALADGLSEAQILAYETANPSWMSPMGMLRYWKKYRSA